MEFSDAIRLGSMIRPQAFYFFFDNDKSCALGGAIEAAGTKYGAFGEADDTIRSKWPWVVTAVAKCPCACDRIQSVRDTVAHLNNDHRWTREQIADWVASVEPALSTTSNRTPDGDAVPVRPTVQMNGCSRQDVVLVSKV